MYGTTPDAVVLSTSPSRECSTPHPAELLATLEAERIPNGSAFTWRPEAPELDDSLPAVAARLRALVDALEGPTDAEREHRAAVLRVVA